MSKKSLLTLLSTAALSAVAAMSVPMSAVIAAPAVAAENARAIKGSYIVRLSEVPVVAYTGGIKGYAATKPRTGQKIDPTSPQVVDYMRYLESRHDAVLAAVGGGRKFYSYGYSFNGFAAKLTETQANALASIKGVLNVTQDAMHDQDTSSTPSFLELEGLWNQLGGPENAGEGIIIGIVDSGIWPENPSFSDRTGANGNGSKDGKLGYLQIPGWHGKCVPGEKFDASLCNQKLIGAQYFNAGWGGSAALEAERPWEFMSVRDYNGHGSHTASTAGGNHGTVVTGPGAALGSISGMAPRARIAAYKALWSTEDASTASGRTSDLVAAIDQAVADGVDVINYSISGTQTNFADPVEIAFLFAADAGVFVAASAGNSGPTSSTVAHPSPWLTTVAAGTHNRSGNGSVTLGNGVTYFGASIAEGVGPAAFIDAADAGLPGADATEVALCYSTLDTDGTPVLDPAKVAGKIVLCDRGVTARVNKSLAVQEAGGIGTILVNVTPGSVNADFHVIPTVHLADTDRAALKAYAATSGATATINDSEVIYTMPAPLTASFSSRGPLRAGGGDLLKPDVIAPGQDILAAYSPMVGGLHFNQISGTSMSSPHVAGLAAVLKHRRPSWTPMMIKSALMTTGYDVLDGGTPAPNTNPVLIFRQGAGHVRPTAAADPGVVYNSGWNDWLAFLCGTTSAVGAGTCQALVNLGYSTDPSNLNVASIAIGDMAGVQTVKRKVTNVSGTNLTITAAVTGMAGFNIVTSPSSLTLAPGQTKPFEIAFTRTSAALNAYTGGQLTWSGGGYAARSPIVVRPVALAAPAEVTSTGAAVSYNVTFGYDGSFSATARGLVAPAITDGSVTDDPTNSTCSLTSPNAQKIDVAVPAGTTYARFALFDVDVNPGTDIDLCVFNGTTLVGSSGSGTSAEQVNLVSPAAATYTVVVQGWGVAGSSPFKLHTWLLGSTDAGNMTVSAPASATTGATGMITVTPAADLPAGRWLGSVAYVGIAGLPNPTIVTVTK